MSHCAAVTCREASSVPELRASLWPPPDGDMIELRIHPRCLDEIRDHSVVADPISEYGRIPAKARCMMCGEKLPLVGTHPYMLALEIGAGEERYWVHAQCVDSNLWFV